MNRAFGTCESNLYFSYFTLQNSTTRAFSIVRTFIFHWKGTVSMKKRYQEYRRSQQSVHTM